MRREEEEEEEEGLGPPALGPLVVGQEVDLQLDTRCKKVPPGAAPPAGGAENLVSSASPVVGLQKHTGDCDAVG